MTLTRRQIARLGAVFGVLLALSVFCAPCGAPIAPVQLVFYLAVGWLLFLVRRAQEVTIDWASVGFAAVAGVLFVLGLHRLLVSLAKGRRGEEKTAWRFKRSLAAAALAMVMFIAGVSMVGLAHQTVWMFTDPEPVLGLDSQAFIRMTSANHMRQMGIALHSYHAVHSSFPPGGVHDARGRMLHGWNAMLLPYLEQGAIHESIDFSKPWNDPAQGEVFHQALPPFLIEARRSLPHHDARGFGLSHYSGNVLVLGGDRPTSLDGIVDGASNTIVLGEAITEPAPWGFPANWRDPRRGMGRSREQFGGPYPDGGAQFTFADGSVRYLSADIDPRVLEAMSTPHGGERFADDGTIEEKPAESR